MPEVTGAGRILIREGTPLPKGLQVDSEPYLPGWRLVRNLEGQGLGQKIQEAGWTFFCLAGEMNATIFGFDEQKEVHRAIARIAGNPKAEAFNALEITRVICTVSKRFLGVTHVMVSARSRHIQEPMVLSPGAGRSEQGRAMVAVA